MEETFLISLGTNHRPASPKELIRGHWLLGELAVLAKPTVCSGFRVVSGQSKESASYDATFASVGVPENDEAAARQHVRQSNTVGVAGIHGSRG